MNPALLIRLRPITPWRIGPDHGALDQSEAVLHSDALYSALCLAFEQLGWLGEWLNATADPYSTPAVRFSSCFPWQRGLLFAPPPMGLWPPAETPGAPTKLRWKGANLVPTTVIASLLSGETLDEKAWTVDAHSGCLIPTGGRFPTGPFRRMRRSSVAVDRVTGTNIQPWAAGCLQFAPASGLWCAGGICERHGVRSLVAQARVRFPPAGRFRARRFCAAAALAARERRTSSQARCMNCCSLVGKCRRPLRMAATGPGGCFRSSPRARPIGSLGGSGNYALLERSGRVASHAGAGLVKKSSRLVREGSMVVSQGALTGSVRDVAPDGAPHPVWRAGFAVAIELSGLTVRTFPRRTMPLLAPGMAPEAPPHDGRTLAARNPNGSGSATSNHALPRDGSDTHARWRRAEALADRLHGLEGPRSTF